MQIARDQRGDDQQAEQAGDRVLGGRRRGVVRGRELLQPDPRHDQLHRHHDRRGHGQQRPQVLVDTTSASREELRSGRAGAPVEPRGPAFTQRCRPARGRPSARRATPSSICSARDARVGDPEELLSPPSSRKSVPFTKTTPRPPRRRLDRADVGALGQVDPQEVAALGGGELGVGQLALERGAQSVAALAQRVFTVSIERVDRARLAELGDDRLRDHAGGDVGLGGDLAGCRRSASRGPAR